MIRDGCCRGPVYTLYMQLKRIGLKAVTVESLTGGLIGSEMTKFPGASEVFLGGVISYRNEMKLLLPGIDADLLATYGPVSKETVSAMATGILTLCPFADISLAVTGLAGPGGGTPVTPVGTVWIASALRKSVGGTVLLSMCVHLTGTRSSIRKQTVSAVAELAMSLLDKER